MIEPAAGDQAWRKCGDDAFEVWTYPANAVPGLATAETLRVACQPLIQLSGDRGMWSDNETDRDFLNFKYVAGIAAEMIARADGQPLSIGVSGSWGVGKSSLMRLLAADLAARDRKDFLFVEFNPWLYQGYDDTRAALMEVLARALVAHAEQSKTAVEGGLERAKGLLARVNWFRVAAAGVKTAASLAAGLPPIGLAGDAVDAWRALTDGDIQQADLDKAEKVVSESAAAGKGVVKDAKPKPPPTPPKAIQDFRDDLEETLDALNVTMVVLIDDLDRCLPPITIATLEAMRLFLFLKRTAFVIAADDAMIRSAVKIHFQDQSLDDDLVTNYFDKLIQVPLRVPPLGTQDVRAYLFLLFIENSQLASEKKEELRGAIGERLGESWQGKRVDRAFLKEVLPDSPAELEKQLDLADRIAPLMTSASKIAGNPRLIKRFLNTLSIRRAIASAQSITVDDAAMAKMLLFERAGPPKAYAELLSKINNAENGKPEFLAALEKAALEDADEVTLEKDWDVPFVREWLTLPPELAGQDLRGLVYVSREQIPIVTAADRLSTEAVGLLEGLYRLTTAVDRQLGERLARLPQHELTALAERLIVRARGATSWGTPPILYAFLTIAKVDGAHRAMISRFLADIPAAQRAASIVPLLSAEPWATEALGAWAADKETRAPVTRAIAAAARKAGG